ncbi:hypothetical protein Cgig2_025081 [Carnegiea gigantea]|uniref:Methylenetetrahydrofolate reductase n=1 Tax=Carnegiea gigantea TaxID=171969 RepID=A0A9Q1KIA7_9CARY|nr:hypothetical protein Cgig2_025081 [Carnegiea gigantea]
MWRTRPSSPSNSSHRREKEVVENLFERMERMVVHGPAFCDITWGAGGSTADLTLEIANRMQNIVCVETMMHLTCTNMPVEKIDHALETIKSNGLQNVLALRGEPPHGQDKFVQVEGNQAILKEGSRSVILIGVEAVNEGFELREIGENGVMRRENGGCSAFKF